MPRSLEALEAMCNGEEESPTPQELERLDRPNRPKPEEPHWSPKELIAIAATVIALCALGVSVYEGYSGRLHRRLSVRPYVSFAFYYNKAGAHFSLDNYGLGPAQVQWFRATVDDKPQGSWREVLRELGLDGVPYTQSIPAKGVMMPPQPIEKSVEILSVKPYDASNTLIENHHRIALEVCYCSLYDECWIASTQGSGPVKIRSCDPAPQETFRWERN